MHTHWPYIRRSATKRQLVLESPDTDMLTRAKTASESSDLSRTQFLNIVHTTTNPFHLCHAYDKFYQAPLFFHVHY